MFKRAIRLAAIAVAIAAAGCSGSDGAQGPQGPQGNAGNAGDPGSPGTPGVSSASTGLKVQVVSVSATSPIQVRFTVKDDRNNPVDLAGSYSVNAQIKPRFALAYTTTSTVNGNTIVNALNVLTKSGTTTVSPTAFDPSAAATAQGTLVENGTRAGDYTYTFPASDNAGGQKAVAYVNTSASHVVYVQATRQTNLLNTDDPKGFTAVNAEYWFVPAGGTAQKREIAATSSCSACHRGFKPGEGSIAGSTFHGGGRVEAPFCNVCHNPARTSNPAADSKVFVHRIHAGHRIQTANQFHGIAATYPQDIRNCGACHAAAAQGDQAYTHPTRAACGSCHDYVSFTGANAGACAVPAAVDGVTGLPVPCNHFGGQAANDDSCTTCHSANAIKGYHLAVAEPDANNVYLNPSATGNANTNAAWLAAANTVPVNATVITYEVASVDAVAATTGLNPSIKFRFLVNGVPTAMDPYGPGTTQIFQSRGFVGAPSVYFAYAAPQDGIAAPSDYNGSASAYVRNLWTGQGDVKTSGGACSKASPCYARAGRLLGPDASSYYTAILDNVYIPSTATMLTGGVGYTYSLGAFDTVPAFVGNNQPLTQTNVAGFAYTANACTGGPGTGEYCGGKGGLIVPAPNVWKVANGFVGRRTIVDNAKCNACHAALGAEPSFHAGQRNDGPTCAFCHTPNRTSSGWSASAKGFVHAIHGARARTTPFNWHAPSATETYAEVEFPGALDNCNACHVTGGYDFTSAAVTKTTGTSTVGRQGSTPCTVAAACTCSTNSPCVLAEGGAAQFAKMLPVTVGAAPSSTVATYGATGGPSSWTISPYVSTSASYGAAYSINGATAAITAAAGTTLVQSPVAAACVGCHDSNVAIGHMEANGGKFYEARSTALGAGVAPEQCMLCHGAGNVAAIADRHKVR